MNDLPQIQPLGKITGFLTHHGFHLEQKKRKSITFFLRFLNLSIQRLPFTSPCLPPCLHLGPHFKCSISAICLNLLTPHTDITHTHNSYSPLRQLIVSLILTCFIGDSLTFSAHLFKILLDLI